MVLFIVSIDISSLVIDVWGIGKSWEIWINMGNFQNVSLPCPRQLSSETVEQESELFWPICPEKVRTKASSELSKDAGLSQQESGRTADSESP